MEKPMKKNRRLIEKVGILVNPEKAGAGMMLRQVCAGLHKHGVKVLVEPRWRSKAGKAEFLTEKKIAANADAVIVIGGDGTILRAGRLMSAKPVPMMGINLGRLGFLATVSPQSARKLIGRLCTGRFDIEKRPFLQAAKGKGRPCIAVNELLFRSGTKSRMAVFSLAVNGRNILNFRGDGLIVASPTGSTAHSLSAGGPIVSPAVPGILITPVCPHLLSSRPLVVPSDTVIHVAPGNPSTGFMMSSDGQKPSGVPDGEAVEISSGKHPLEFVVFDQAEYYRILTRKLGWGMQAGDTK